jgi:hypothetical protein
MFQIWIFFLSNKIPLKRMINHVAWVFLEIDTGASRLYFVRIYFLTLTKDRDCGGMNMLTVTPLQRTRLLTHVNYNSKFQAAPAGIAVGQQVAGSCICSKLSHTSLGTLLE